jgi:cytidyltransferase-like protein
MDENVKLKLGIVSGGFDPIHCGHVRYLKAAKAMCDKLLVILNGDSFLIRKKGYFVFNSEERHEILLAMKVVDYVRIHNSDADDVVDMLGWIYNEFNECELIFMKGGDRSPLGKPIPEVNVCRELGIQIMYGVGGYDKPNSSSLVGAKAIQSIKGVTV